MFMSFLQRTKPRSSRRAGVPAVGVIVAVAMAVPVSAAAAAPASAATSEGGALDPQGAADAPSATADAHSAAVRGMTRDRHISPAQARQRLRGQDAKAHLAKRLTGALDSRAAGTFIDNDSGTLVVNVTSAQAADRVRSTAARPRLVGRSTDRLQRIQARLQRTAVTGTTLAIDVRDNAVEVTVPGGQTASKQRFVRRARSFGDAVRVKRVASAPRTNAFYGGEAITGGGSSRCSAGFVADGHIITAGHCTAAISSWDSDKGHVGPSVDSSFPGNDYGLIRVDGSINPVGAVLDGNDTTDITSAGTPPVGTYVCKTGSTTGTTCGSILDYNVTVNYPKGSVNGLIKTDVCTQAGDSGGALFEGSTAVGVTSGGTNTACDSSSFRAFFQPVQEALDAYGLNLS